MKNVITAPRKYGSPIFDAMECPLEILPKTFLCKYRTSEGELKSITLPTAECFEPGNFVSRKYAGIKTPLVHRALRERGIRFWCTVWDDETGIRILLPKYVVENG